jgi:rhodanese-related sulfurtransferase
MPKTAAQLVSDAKASIENLTVDQVAEEMSSGSPLLVDLREPEERARTGTIPGAVLAPRGMLEFYADPASTYHRTEFDPRQRTILYCAGGGRSALAAQSLKQLGYTNVAHLEGGMNAWAASGRDLSRD